MKRQLFTKLTLIACVCTVLGMATETRADHETGVYLDPLRNEVTGWLESGVELTRQQQNALNGAARTLGRDGKTAMGDLRLLNSAANALNRAFPEEQSVVDAEEASLANYVALAESQLAELQAQGESLPQGLPAAFGKLLSQASASLETAQSEESFAVRVRAVTKALTKLKAAQNVLTRTIKAPGGTEEGQQIVLVARGGGAVVLASDGSYIIGEGEEAEAGTWEYARTGPKSASVFLTPHGGESREYVLTFRNPTSGTFVGPDARGKFVIEDEPAPEEPPVE